MNVDPSQQADSSKGFEAAEDIRLDEALCRWNERTIASTQHLGALQNRIQQTLTAQTSLTTLPTLPTPVSNSVVNPRQTLVRFAFAAFACAATLLIAIGGTWIYRVGTGDSRKAQSVAGPDSMQANNSGVLPALATTTLQTQQALLAGFRDVYGNQVQFVSEIDGRLHIELDQQPSSSTPPNRQFIAVRFVLVSREIDRLNASWQVVHSANLLAGQERQIEITDTKTLLQISLWAFPVDVNRVNLDLHCHWNLAVPIELTRSELEQVGEARAIYSATHNGVEYRLYQTVLRLNEDSDSQVSSTGLTNTGGES